MPRAATTKAPRKALGDAPSTVLNKKPSSDEVDSAPVKKAKKATVEKVDLLAQMKTATPPAFLSEVDLPGEDRVLYPCVVS